MGQQKKSPAKAFFSIKDLNLQIFTQKVTYRSDKSNLKLEIWCLVSMSGKTKSSPQLCPPSSAQQPGLSPGMATLHAETSHTPKRLQSRMGHTHKYTHKNINIHAHTHRHTHAHIKFFKSAYKTTQ